jgi:hypothetical protein
MLGLCVAISFCLPALGDIIESFDASGDNRDWGTDYGTWTQLFVSNYLENGAKHSDSGGVSGGYDYIDVDWAPSNWNLIFADSDASGGTFAGNKNYTAMGVTEMSAYVMRSSSNIPAATFFFVSDASGTTPSQSSTVWYYNLFIPSTSWPSQPLTAPMTSSTNWTPIIPSGSGTPRTWAASIADVDLVGVMLIDATETGNPEMRIDEFTVTPEPCLLLTMAPLGAFLGWRLRRNRKKGDTVQP